MIAALRRIVCGLRGHDALLAFEDGRMLLRCNSCGWDSHGWTITAPTAATTERPMTLRLVHSKAHRAA